MRWWLVAPGDLVRLVGIGGVMIRLGLAGDLVADWVHERQLPSDPIVRHLITCLRCSGGEALCPPDGCGHWRCACPELARLNAPALARGLAIAAAHGRSEHP
jgi:hypothetical protein